MNKLNQLAIEIIYAQSKDVDLSVDDWRKKLKSLLKEQKLKLQEEYAHPTEEGYCCACDYDLAVFEENIRDTKIFSHEEGYDLGVSHYKQHIKDKLKKIQILADQEQALETDLELNNLLEEIKK